MACMTAAAELPPQWERVLRYEAAVDIVTSLMAQCTAVEWLAERADEVVVRQNMRSLRRAYLAELSELDPRNTTAVARVIRGYGTTLAGKVEAPRLHLPSWNEPAACRLDRAAHAAVFRDRIAPETLSTPHPRERPMAVILTGPPGSGKTTALRCRYHSWDDAAPVLIDPGIYPAFHPRSWDLVRADDARAGAAVEADALEWAAMAVDYTIGHRNDVLLAVGEQTPRRRGRLRRQFPECRLPSGERHWRSLSRSAIMRSRSATTAAAATGQC